MKIILALICMAMLAGCATGRSYEAVSDVWIEEEMPAAKQIRIILPADAAASTIESEGNGTIYLCDGYTVMTQTFLSGDLDATLRMVTGFEADALNVIPMQDGDLKKYVCAWVSAGETGDQVGRCLILDDGHYHYTVTMLAGEFSTNYVMEAWECVLSSMLLSSEP